MNILNSQTRTSTLVRPTPTPQTSSAPAKVPAEEPHASEPLDETLVEGPHVLLELSHLQEHSPVVGNTLQVGFSGLAFVRAAQCFGEAGWEGKLEGTSALALGVAGMATMLPGGLGESMHHSALAGHGLLEVGLGAHATYEALKSEDKDWRDIADGTLGTVKGLATITPMFAPGLEHASHLVELGALVGRVGLKLTR